MGEFILDLLFPIRCLGCGQEREFICSTCFEEIPLNKEPPLISQEPTLAGLMVASDYDYPLVKQAIHRYKYDFVKDLAKPLGQLMIKKLTATLYRKGTPFILIPVPLHKKRLRWRGFNQAELLAEVISQEIKIPLISNLLVRARHDLPQVQIKSSQERKENIKQAFRINKTRTALAKQGLPLSDLSNKTIILIDDISTTGATLEECASVLKPLKPKEIWGLVVARG